MKVLITGKNSYIGCHIREWLEKSEDDFQAECIGVRGNEWKQIDFSQYQAVIHAAGIVHRKDITDWTAYQSVNVDLTAEIARKAKSSGVHHFVFLSSMGVYGLEKTLPHSAVIDNDTIPAPNSLYGRSKLWAEQELKKLQDSNFTVTFVRPPNVYGKDCPGGYIKGYSAIVRYVPIIPRAFENAKQSMLYIDNLCELIRLILISGAGGTFLPQDDVIPTAVQLMAEIYRGMGKRVRQSTMLGRLLSILPKVSVVRKVYGGIEYSAEISDCFENRYVVVPFREAVKRTVN